MWRLSADLCTQQIQSVNEGKTRTRFEPMTSAIHLRSHGLEFCSSCNFYSQLLFLLKSEGITYVLFATAVRFETQLRQCKVFGREWVAVSARELLDFDKVNEFHVKHVEALQEPHIAQIVFLFFYFEALPIHLSGFLLCNSCVLESALWVTVETQSVSVVFYDYIYVSSW